MAKQRLTLAEINALDQEGFVSALGGVFEGPPWIVVQAWQARPFHNFAHLYQVLCTVMYEAPPQQQVALIQVHPDLVGKAALDGTLSAQSTGEQAAAGLDRLSPEDIAAFRRLNQAYRDRFGFPFVICARENKKESILAGFGARLDNARDQETAVALAEIAKICRLRLQDMVEADGVDTVTIQDTSTGGAK